MKKLVELDPESFTTKEVDHKKILRSAHALRDYLQHLAPEEDQYRIKEYVLPIVDEALAGTLRLPFSALQQPLIREGADGLLPREYEKLSAPFFVAIMGMSGLGSDLIKPIHKEGKVYAWMEFED